MPTVLFGGSAVINMTLGGWEAWCAESVSVFASWAWRSTMGMWPAMWCHAIGHQTGAIEGINDVDQYAGWRSAYAAFATSWFDRIQGYCPDLISMIMSVKARLQFWSCGQLGAAVLGLQRWGVVK